LANRKYCSLSVCHFKHIFALKFSIFIAIATGVNLAEVLKKTIRLADRENALFVHRFGATRVGLTEI